MEEMELERVSRVLAVAEEKGLAKERRANE
jgi:hypothetical protein